MSSSTAQVSLLRRLLTGEVTKTLGLSAVRWSYPPTELLTWVPARRFAQLGVPFDGWVAQWGLVEAARRVLDEFVSDYRAYGAEHVPSEGPLLLAANHPGAYDALTVAVSARRDDLRILVGDLGFLRELPHVRRHMIFAALDAHIRANAIRAVVRHLRSGGAVLVFPSGHLDPDPEVLPGADEGLDEWSSSVSLMLRRAPETRAVVTVVSGVLDPRCARSPLTLVRRSPRARQRMAEFAQVSQQLVFGRRFPVTPKVSFSEPVTGAGLCAAYGRSGMTEALTERARHLLATHPVLSPVRAGT